MCELRLSLERYLNMHPVIMEGHSRHFEYSWQAEHQLILMLILKFLSVLGLHFWSFQRFTFSPDVSFHAGVLVLLSVREQSSMWSYFLAAHCLLCAPIENSDVQRWDEKTDNGMSICMYLHGGPTQPKARARTYTAAHRQRGSTEPFTAKWCRILN